MGPGSEREPFPRAFAEMIPWNFRYVIGVCAFFQVFKNEESYLPFYMVEDSLFEKTPARSLTDNVVFQ